MPQFTEGPVNADFTGVLQVCFIFAKSNLQFPSIGNQKELLSGGFIKKYIFADLLTLWPRLGSKAGRRPAIFN